MDDNLEIFYKNRNQHMPPPGTYFENIQLPYDEDGAIQIAILNEHRFAFYYWLKWTNGLVKKGNEIPSLVTIDWHNDLARLNVTDKELLEDLNQSDLEEVNYFTWSKLHPQNDDQITSAIYLNLIKNVYVLSKQTDFQNKKKFIIKDKYEFEHKIKIFKDIQRMEKYIQKLNNETFYIDFDLDYFVNSSDVCGENGKIIDKTEIMNIINPQRKIYKKVFENIKGFTIAREPKWCNGIRNSNFLMDILNKQFFNSTLLSKKVNWNKLHFPRHSQ